MPSSSTIQFEPIRITGVIIDQIGIPRDDGTRGSALYRVPFRLSRTPPKQWASMFVDAWNRHPRFTTMHRPGIASIVGDTVILDGTTVDEVKNYHRDTLILAVDLANKNYTDSLETARIDEEREARRLLEHKREVEEKAKVIKFNDD